MLKRQPDTDRKKGGARERSIESAKRQAYRQI